MLSRRINAELRVDVVVASSMLSDSKVDDAAIPEEDEEREEASS